jgi:colicin import membrane protein
MPRTLKTFVTSVGFFEQAIAAPSMKAALDAWGSNKNLFHQGFAEESDDPQIVAATMAKPGVVLKRAVGSKGAFTENAELPKSLPTGKPVPRAKPKAKVKAAKGKKGPSADIVSLADARAAKHAAVLYEKERARQERQEAKEEAKRQKERERRDEAVAAAEAVLEKAIKRHNAIRATIANEREALDRRDEQEEARWEKEKKTLETELRQAGD